ncbi:MAG: TonB-dependent receptor, partial [Nitrospirae bacterium]|nr:TonB-dependent receptor [Nitrospirota bacterium]
IGYRPTDQTELSVSLTYVKDRLHQAGSLPLSQVAISPRLNFTPGDFVDNETSVLRFTGRHTFALGFALNVNGFYRRLGQEQYTVGQSSVADNLAQTESKGGTLQVTHDASFGSSKNALVIGSELTRNDFNNSAVAAFTGFGSFPSARSSNEDIVAFYAQDTFTVIPSLAITVGARYDHDQLGFTDKLTSANNGSRRFNRTTTRAGLSYAVSPSLTTYFNYGEGFRVPTFDELFAQGGFGSNPNLNAVRSRTYEIGAKIGRGSSIEGSLAAFQTDVRDEIFFTCRVCDFTDGQNRNIDKTRRRGIEATVKARYGKLFDAVLNYTFTEAHFRSQVNFTAPTARLVQIGDSLPQVPKNRLSVTANVHPADGWTLSLIGLYVSTQFHLNDEDNAQPRLPGYFQLNARVNYERPVPGGRLSGFLMLNNLLNENYATSGIIASNVMTGGGATERFIVPVPGLAAFGGLSYKFESF